MLEEGDFDNLAATADDEVIDLLVSAHGKAQGIGDSWVKEAARASDHEVVDDQPLSCLGSAHHSWLWGPPPAVGW